MKIATILALILLTACVGETLSDGSGGSTSSSIATGPSMPEEPRDSSEPNGSMCDLYGTIEVEIEGKPSETTVIVVPTLCDPYYHYEGYPWDINAPEEDRSLPESVDLAGPR